MGTWSIDAIAPSLRNEDYSVLRIVKYHEDNDTNPGIRYIAINARQEQPFLWGEAYDFPTNMLRGTNTTEGLLFLDMPGELRRQIAVEERLHSSGLQVFQQYKMLTTEMDTTVDATGFPERNGEPACWAKIHVHNVGQGDTIVLELPNDQIWLIDARLWGNIRRQEFTDWMDRRFHGRRHFNKLIATHMHYDHIHSIPFILNEFTVDEVLVPDSLIHKTASARRVWELSGHRLRTGITSIQNRFGSLTTEIIQTNSVPLIQHRVNASIDPNFHELVVTLTTPTSAAFLSGDTPGDCCHQIVLGSNLNGTHSLRERYYKVSHHGSRTGHDNSFFNLYPSSHAVISCGLNNKFHHPHNPPTHSLPTPYIITHRDGQRVYPHYLV